MIPGKYKNKLHLAGQENKGQLYIKRNQYSQEFENFENIDPMYYEVDMVNFLKELVRVLNNKNSSDSDVIEAFTQFSEGIKCFKPNQQFYSYFIQQNFTELFLFLLQSAKNEIFESILWTISIIFFVSFRYDNKVIVNEFTKYNLFDFLLSINISNIPKNSIPSYLNILSYYCLLDEKTRDTVINQVFFPLKEFLFDDLNENELVKQAAIIIDNSTRFRIKNTEYKKWVLQFFLVNYKFLDENIIFYFLKSIKALCIDPSFIDLLFLFHFEGFLERSLKNFTFHEHKNFILDLQNFMLKKDPSRVNINYAYLMELGSSPPLDCCAKAFKTFRNGIKFRKCDNPLSDIQLYNSFLNLLRDGPYEVKYELVKCIYTWFNSSPKKDIITHVPSLLPEIIQIIVICDDDTIISKILIEIKIIFDIFGTHGFLEQLKELPGIPDLISYIQSLDIIDEAISQNVNYILSFF